MKTRLAKKIMNQQCEYCLPRNKKSRYWFIRWSNFERFCVGMYGKADHRIIKAMSLTSKIMKHED